MKLEKKARKQFFEFRKSTTIVIGTDKKKKTMILIGPIFFFFFFFYLNGDKYPYSLYTIYFKIKHPLCIKNRNIRYRRLEWANGEA